MRNIYSLVLMVILSASAFSAMANSIEQGTPKAQKEMPVQNNSQGENTETVKLYTSLYFQTPGVPPIIYYWLPYPANVSLIINGELVIAKNQYAKEKGYSYLEVDKKYNFKEISEAKFNWEEISQGKKLTISCIGDGMPRYVQEGEKGVGTELLFRCVSK